MFSPVQEQLQRAPPSADPNGSPRIVFKASELEHAGNSRKATEVVMTQNLTFVGPCIANIFAEYNQQDGTFYIYFCKMLYMFQTGFPVHFQELKTAHTASGICQTNT